MGVLTWGTSSAPGTSPCSLLSTGRTLTTTLTTTRTGSSPTTPGSTLVSAPRPWWPASSSSSTSAWAASTKNTGTAVSQATSSSSLYLYSRQKTKLPWIFKMFTYWPFIGLLTSGVMVAILLVIKFGDKLCKARLTTLSDQTMAPFPDQVGSSQSSSSSWKSNRNG